MAKRKKTEAAVAKDMQTAQERMVFMESTFDVLEIGYNTNNNVVLYGAGGFGKSDIAESFLRAKGHEPFVFTCGSGTTGERMFGGTDIKKFTEEGKLFYQTDFSFLNHEYVILEEMMDAPDFILEQLKDTLSSGVFRNGEQQVPIKTKMIICCTNHDRKDYAKDNPSILALMERFPLELKVEWKAYTKEAYAQLFNTVYGDGDPTLSYILEQMAAKGTIVSPRIALKAHTLIKECGDTKCLVFLAAFAGQGSIIKQSVAKFKAYNEFMKKTEVITDINDKLAKIDIGNSSAEELEDASVLAQSMEKN